MLAILVPASVTVVGYWFKQQDDRRLVQEQNDSEKERFQAREKEKDRLRLDAAMKAAALFEPTGSDAHDSAKADRRDHASDGASDDTISRLEGDGRPGY
jgi:hypothetical protein